MRPQDGGSTVSYSRVGGRNAAEAPRPWHSRAEQREASSSESSYWGGYGGNAAGYARPAAAENANGRRKRLKRKFRYCRTAGCEGWCEMFKGKPGHSTCYLCAASFENKPGKQDEGEIDDVNDCLRKLRLYQQSGRYEIPGLAPIEADSEGGEQPAAKPIIQEAPPATPTQARQKAEKDMRQAFLRSTKACDALIRNISALEEHKSKEAALEQAIRDAEKEVDAANAEAKTLSDAYDAASREAVAAARRNDNDQAPPSTDMETDHVEPDAAKEKEDEKPGTEETAKKEEAEVWEQLKNDATAIFQDAAASCKARGAKNMAAEPCQQFLEALQKSWEKTYKTAQERAEAKLSQARGKTTTQQGNPEVQPADNSGQASTPQGAWEFQRLRQQQQVGLERARGRSKAPRAHSEGAANAGGEPTRTRSATRSRGRT